MAFYNEMKERSTTDDEGNTVFVGSVLEVFNHLGISLSLYSRVKRLLVRSESIEILQRGTAHQPSIVLLRAAPTSEAFADEGLTNARRHATLIQELERRLETLEGWRQSLPPNLSEALREHESRLYRLEKFTRDIHDDQMGSRTQENAPDGESKVELTEQSEAVE
jgi:hypothetical protein